MELGHKVRNRHSYKLIITKIHTVDRTTAEISPEGGEGVYCVDIQEIIIHSVERQVQRS